MTNFADQIENVLKEGIEEYLGERNFKDEIEAALNDYDFSGVVKDAVRDHADVEREVEKAVDDYDFSDAILDCVRDYDWWEEIEDKVKDDMETMVEEAVASAVTDVLASVEFKATVWGIVVEMVWEKVSEVWGRMCYPFKKVWSWIKVS